jgi:hypothetical protein
MPIGAPTIAATTAPVPAPIAPVLTARHPGVTPQPARASDVIISPAAKAPERVIYSSLFVDQQLPKRVGLRPLLRAKLSHGAAVAENQLWAQELTFDERPPMTLGNAAAAQVVSRLPPSGRARPRRDGRALRRRDDRPGLARGLFAHTAGAEGWIWSLAEPSYKRPFWAVRSAPPDFRISHFARAGGMSLALFLLWCSTCRGRFGAPKSIPDNSRFGEFISRFGSKNSRLVCHGNSLLTDWSSLYFCRQKVPETANRREFPVIFPVRGNSAARPTALD